MPFVKRLCLLGMNAGSTAARHSEFGGTHDLPKVHEAQSMLLLDAALTHNAGAARCGCLTGTLRGTWSLL